MDDSLKEQIDIKQGNSGFIKVTDSNAAELGSSVKVALNRKGNEFFNSGDIEGARRIFTTTGYSDGLTRIGDAYMEKNEPLKAIKHYYLAKNKRKLEPLYEKLAQAISVMVSQS